MNRSTRRALLTAIIIAASMHAMVGAQAQIGQNINVITGIDDPTTGDPFRQRHNESVIAISGVNSDHMVVAYNDYSMVDIANDQDVGTPTPAQSAVARLYDLLLTPWRGDRPDTKRRVENVDKASANAWIGWSFSDNGGKNWVRGLHHGHPFETSGPPGAGQLKSYNFQAASDPVLASTQDKFYLAAIAFTPNGGSAGFVSVLTDYNDTETGRNIRYDSTKILLSTPTATHFIDKPSVAALGNKVYAAFVVFDESDPAKLSSKILFFRSSDRGNTWSNGAVISNPLTRNQAPWLLIDPNNENTVYVGWRVFSAQTGGFTNAIIGKKSVNGGVSFTTSLPWPVALLLKAFDQPQGVLGNLSAVPPQLPMPRSNAYPTATIDGNGTIHVALQEWVNPTTGLPLGPQAAISTGVPRITVTSSYNGGVLWTLRKAIDFGPNTGTQFMPVITAVGERGTSCTGFNGPRSRVMVMYYDARASTYTGYVAGGRRQFDVRIAEASACDRDALGRPLFSPSKQLSQYSLDPQSNPPGQIIKRADGYGTPAVNQAFEMFGGGTKSFTGDYIGLSPRVPYVLTPTGWKLTIANGVDRDKLPAPVVQGVWPDTRTALQPTNPPPTLPPNHPLFVDSMAWWNYQPPHSGNAPPQCMNPGSRSQDVFTAQYAPNGLFAAAPRTLRISATAKPYPLYVENRFPLKRYFRLTIDPAADASFNYKTFAPTPPNPQYDRSADVEIGPFSTVTGTVVVGPAVSSPVAINIVQITGLGGSVVAGGARTAVTMNSAGNAADDTESHDPVVQQTPTITHPFAGTNVLPRAAGPANPLPAPYTDNPYTDNPYTDNPYTDNVIVYNVIASSVSVQNGGDASGAYTALLRIQNALALQGNYVFQTFIERVSKNPGLDGCQTVEVHQNTPVSAIKAPYTDNPYTDNPYTDNPYTDNPYTDNPYTDNVSPEDAAARVSNSTFYLTPAGMTQPPDSGSAVRAVDEVRYHLWASQIRPTAQLTAVFTPATQLSLTVVPETPNVIVLAGGGVGFDPGGPTPGNSGAGVAVKLAFSLQPPPTVGPGHRFTVQVAVQDANSAVVANSTRTVTLALDGSPAGATLSGTLTKNAVNGIATFDDVAVDRIQGGYALVASSVGVTSAISNSFDVTVNLNDQIAVLNTDFLSVGYGGLRYNSETQTGGTGTIAVSGVQGSVTGAILYWHGPTRTSTPGINSQVTFAGQPITGVNVGIASDNNWGYLNSQAYAADVTALVTGNGDYSLANFVKNPDGIVADINGVSLIVFFNDGSASNNRDVYFRGTNDSNVTLGPPYFADTWNHTLTGINYGGGNALLELHVGDGQGFGDDGVNLNGVVTVPAGCNFQGTSVQNEPPPAAECVLPGGGVGGLWDIRSWAVPTGVFGESSSVTLSQPSFSNNDYLSLVVMLISVPHTPPVVIP